MPRCVSWSRLRREVQRQNVVISRIREGPKPLDKYEFLPYDRVGSIVDSEMSEDEDMTEDQDTTLLNDMNWNNPSCPVEASAAAKIM